MMSLLNKPRISVALVTRNRPDSLLRTLKSLAPHRAFIYEVVISDDSNTPEMANETLQLANNFECKYVSGPQKGLYANRNFVAKQCSGTHIRTMDDDHEFPENHFEVCMQAVEAHPDTIWTIGEYFPKDVNRPIPGPIPPQLHPRGFSYAPKDMTKYFGISCGASIYPKQVVDNGDLNSEAYKFGILYLEYGARLYKKGYKIRHLDGTYVIHHYNENDRSISSTQIINEAEIFSMMMLSFKHQPSVSNITLTLMQILRGLVTGRYSMQLLKGAYNKVKIA